MASQVDKKRCDECAFAYLREDGYSDYTSTGTMFYCTKKLNPASGVDTFYSEAKELEFAEQCSEFTPGGPGAHICVDNCEYDFDLLSPAEQEFAIAFWKQEPVDLPWWYEARLARLAELGTSNTEPAR